jgi:hypothetical protein
MFQNIMNIQWGGFHWGCQLYVTLIASCEKALGSYFILIMSIVCDIDSLVQESTRILLYSGSETIVCDIVCDIASLHSILILFFRSICTCQRTRIFHDADIKIMLLMLTT